MNWKFWKSSQAPATAGKESAMGDTNATATPPAASGALTAEQITDLVTKAATAAATNAVSKAIEPITTSVKALETGFNTIKETVEKVPAAPSAEAIGKIVTDQLTARESSAATAKAKSTFAAESLK